MSASTANRPQYKLIAGVVPCPAGWLILPARLAGVTVNVEDAEVVKTFLEVLDYKPKFDAAAVWAPIGYYEEPVAPYRPCDIAAKEMIGWPRSVAVRPTPSRAALHARTREEAKAIEPWLTNDDLRRFKWWRQAEEMFQPFHHRNYFSAHPDLSYVVLNGDQPVTSSPYQLDGVQERMELIRNKLPGVEEVILRLPPKGAAQIHVVQAAGLLWTARRASGRAINRLPLDPNWDSNGIRMELVR
jgi:predicted RNase H-like nuclease